MGIQSTGMGLRRRLIQMLLAAGVMSFGLMGAGSALAAADALVRLPAAAKQGEGYAAPDSCLGCHVGQDKLWRDSDHAWSMRPASGKNVLGNFENVRFDEAGVEARFFRKGDAYYVNIEGDDGKPADFEILYTFGYFPLQQYLVALPRGRLQALTIAWDSRTQAEGGNAGSPFI